MSAAAQIRIRCRNSAITVMSHTDIFKNKIPRPEGGHFRTGTRLRTACLAGYPAASRRLCSNSSTSFASLTEVVGSQAPTISRRHSSSFLSSCSRSRCSSMTAHFFSIAMACSITETVGYPDIFPAVMVSSRTETMLPSTNQGPVPRSIYSHEL